MKIISEFPGEEKFQISIKKHDFGARFEEKIAKIAIGSQIFHFVR